MEIDMCARLANERKELKVVRTVLTENSHQYVLRYCITVAVSGLCGFAHSFIHTLCISPSIRIIAEIVGYMLCVIVVLLFRYLNYCNGGLLLFSARYYVRVRTLSTDFVDKWECACYCHCECIVKYTDEIVLGRDYIIYIYIYSMYAWSSKLGVRCEMCMVLVLRAKC